jgi:hypothetical protein
VRREGVVYNLFFHCLQVYQIEFIGNGVNALSGESNLSQNFTVDRGVTKLLSVAGSNPNEFPAAVSVAIQMAIQLTDIINFCT